MFTITAQANPFPPIICERGSKDEYTLTSVPSCFEARYCHTSKMMITALTLRAAFVQPLQPFDEAVATTTVQRGGPTHWNGFSPCQDSQRVIPYGLIKQLMNLALPTAFRLTRQRSSQTVEIVLSCVPIPNVSLANESTHQLLWMALAQGRSIEVVQNETATVRRPGTPDEYRLHPLDPPGGELCRYSKPGQERARSQLTELQYRVEFVRPLPRRRAGGIQSILIRKGAVYNVGLEMSEPIRLDDPLIDVPVALLKDLLLSIHSYGEIEISRRGRTVIVDVCDVPLPDDLTIYRQLAAKVSQQF